LTASLDEILASLTDLEPALNVIAQKSNSELRQELMDMLVEAQTALLERLSQFRGEPSESMAIAMRPAALSDAARRQILQMTLQEPDARLAGRKMESLDAGDKQTNTTYLGMIRRI